MTLSKYDNTTDLSVQAFFAPGQTIFVNADVSGTWTTQSGGTTNLFATIDEPEAIDTDFIRSTQSPLTPSITRLAFGPMTMPGSRTQHAIEYRYGKDVTGPDLILTAKLYEGATLLATDESITVTSTIFKTRTWNIPDTVAEVIGDYGNLEIQLEAVLA
jgi:hypothetical protein